MLIFGSGKACFTGYAIDLLNTLAEQLQFDYTIYIVEDGKYGSYNENTGKWNGVVGDLIEDENGQTVSLSLFVAVPAFGQEFLEIH